MGGDQMFGGKKKKYVYNFIVFIARRISKSSLGKCVCVFIHSSCPESPNPNPNPFLFFLSFSFFPTLRKKEKKEEITLNTLLPP